MDAARVRSTATARRSAPSEGDHAVGADQRSDGGEQLVQQVVRRVDATQLVDECEPVEVHHQHGAVGRVGQAVEQGATRHHPLLCIPLDLRHTSRIGRRPAR
jgi:hypothetical protein